LEVTAGSLRGHETKGNQISDEIKRPTHCSHMASQTA